MAFNQKMFSILLTMAKGDRSWRRFAMDCGISYVQMRKLALMQQENSPRPKLVNKIARNAGGGVTAEDLFFCIDSANGKEDQKLSAAEKQSDLFREKFQSLSMGQKKMVIEFMDFLLNKQ